MNDGNILSFHDSAPMTMNNYYHHVSSNVLLGNNNDSNTVNSHPNNTNDNQHMLQHLEDGDLLSYFLNPSEQSPPEQRQPEFHISSTANANTIGITSSASSSDGAVPFQQHRHRQTQEASLPSPAKVLPTIKELPQIEQSRHRPPDPPLTPAIQFYTSSSHKKKNSTASPPPPPPSSSSSSSLVSLAAAIVNGVNPFQLQILQQHLQQQSQQHANSNTTISPISPVAQMGSPQENMIFPPPTVSSSKPSSSSSSSTTNTIHLPAMAGNASYSAGAANTSQADMTPLHTNATIKTESNTTNNANQPYPTNNSIPNAYLQQHQHLLQQAYFTAHNNSNNMIQPQNFITPQSQLQILSTDLGESNISNSTSNPTNNNIPVPTIQNTTNNVNNQTEKQQIVSNNQLLQQHVQWLHQMNAIVANNQQHQQLSAFPNPFPPNVGENEERRARRLERNRLSARQSRRRKKDLLIKLGIKVQELQTVLEMNRSLKLQEMEMQLQHHKKQSILEYKHEETIDELPKFLHESGPNNSIRRAAIAFQYYQLKQLILPYHQHFLMWLFFQHKESFLLKAKELRTKTHTGTGRISSKMLGEEITTDFNNDKNEEQQQNDANPKINCFTEDEMKVWPLLCYELSISVEQEEKFVQTFKRMKSKIEKLYPIQKDISSATSMIDQFQKGLSFQSHSAAKRNARVLVDLLTPMQSKRFLEYRVKNSRKLDRLLAKKLPSSSDQESTSSNSSTTSSLDKICEKLTNALNLPTQQ